MNTSSILMNPSLPNALRNQELRFVRHGYFVADRVGNTAGKLVFNLAVGLKDSWGK